MQGLARDSCLPWNYPTAWYSITHTTITTTLDCRLHNNGEKRRARSVVARRVVPDITNYSPTKPGRSRSRPTGHNSTASRSSRDYSQHSPALPKRAASSVRRVDDHRDLSAKFKQLEVNGANGSANDGNGAQPTHRVDSAGSGHTAAQYAKESIPEHLQQEEGGYGLQDAPLRNMSRDGEPVINVRRSDDPARPPSARLSNDMTRSGSSRISNSNGTPRNVIPAAAVPPRDASQDWQRQNGGASTRRMSPPVDQRRHSLARDGQAVKNFSTPSTQPRAPPDHVVHDSDAPIDLAAHGINLTNTEDTTVHTTSAPAVVHETVRVDTHEIVTERVEREIHTHDVYHRILPIVDIEVLPPRHFVQTPAGGRYEISADKVPGGAAQNLNLQRVIQEAVDRELARLYPPQSGPRRFTALEFDPRGTVGDFREGVGENGCHFSEQTWVHPPVIDMGGYETGQTVPFHFDHSHVQSSAGGVVGNGSVVYDDHQGGIGRVPSVGEKGIPGRRIGSISRKPVPL